MGKPGMKVVDLFCGCGGFGLGAKQAGFDVVVAVDIDPTLQSAYKKNFPSTNVITRDLSKMARSDWDVLLEDQAIDGVIGGPPCQGYSRIGKRDINDPRRTLLGHFFRTVNLISPKFFVMENVEGLLDEKNKEELYGAIALADKKYTVLPPMVVDASNFGAPTKRKRVVVIGFDPKETPGLDLINFELISLPKVTVKDAIWDIGEPISQQRNGTCFGWAPYRDSDVISNYALKMRKKPQDGIGWANAIQKLAQGLISGNFDTVHSPSVRSRYKSLLPGSTDPVSRSKKLEWKGVAPTLRAGTGSDKGSHQAVRPLHPRIPRVITVREAARLQGFPDWFCFHHTKWHSFRMIGNSVSPLVSEEILKKVLQTLKARRSRRSEQ